MGIGTSEVAQVLASQCILQSKPKTMRINIEGTLPEGTTAKDVALYIMAQMTTSGATGYAVEYAGSAVRNMSMEGRLTLSNLSIEMGSRAGLIAPDETTFAYLKGREYAPKGEDWDKAVEEWKKLYSDPDAVFDKEVTYRAEDIAPRITYGTNPVLALPSTSASLPSTRFLRLTVLSSSACSNTCSSNQGRNRKACLLTTASSVLAPMVASKTSVLLPRW